VTLRLVEAEEVLPGDYGVFLDDLKGRIRSAQIRAAVSVNRELVLLYWQIGREILERQGREGWGAKIIDRLAGDLQQAFPDLKGFSARNLKYMRALAEAFPDEAIVQQVVAQLPWGHHTVLLAKAKNPVEREWCIRKTIEHGWSRAVLTHHIETDLYQRQGRAVSNFARTLPSPQSDLAQAILKDPYSFDFLTLADDAREKELERGLLDHLRQFLLELGVGFAFLGQQYRLEVGGDEFFVDLLFYHCRLHCYVVVDLKTGSFQPEFAGKMNFYLSAVDDLLRESATDQPSIGLILCREKNRIVVEYALRDLSKPIGVAEFETRLLQSLPEDLRGALPTIEEIERELEGTEAGVERGKADDLAD
jgi:predicted nuclease of restriction endonuclease-like (RecB) superfamily